MCRDHPFYHNFFGRYFELQKCLHFLEDDRAMLTLSDSENESDDEEIPDLGNIFIAPDIVESSDDSDGEETAINSIVLTEKVDRVLKICGMPGGSRV